MILHEVQELEQKLQKYGCYELYGKQIHEHPTWYSPITGKKFAMSNHKSKEVASGTLRTILKEAGIIK